MAAIAGASLLLAMTGCDMEIRDKYTPPAVSSVYVGFGGENTFNVTNVTVDGTSQTSLIDSSFAPSAWNAFSEFKTVSLEAGETAVFTFLQPTQGSGAYNTWGLAFYDDNDYGDFLRGDNWLNSYSDAGFSGAKWVNGNSSANGTYSNDYTYLTSGSQLPTDATVTLTVTFDGTDVTVTETVNGTTAYTTSSGAW